MSGSGVLTSTRLGSNTSSFVLTADVAASAYDGHLGASLRAPGTGGGAGAFSTEEHSHYGSHASERSDGVPSAVFYHYPMPRGTVPPARWAHSAVAIHGEVYTFGGVGHAMMDDLNVLDVHTMTWRTGLSTHAARSKDRPEKMLGHAAAAVGNKVMIFGGQSGRKFLRTLYSLDVDALTWVRYPSDNMPPARAGHAMATVHGSVIYMFGGQGKKLYNDLYKLDAATGTFTEVEAAGKPPCPRRGHSLVWDGRDCLVCFGGITQSGATDNHLSVFCLSRGEWLAPQAFGPAPSPRTQHSATMIAPGVVLFFGGCNSSGTFYSDVSVLDTRGCFTWHRPQALSAAPAPRYHHTCCLVGNRLVLYGGINSKQTFEGVVVLETKLGADISLVAEELFRMSAETSLNSSLVTTPNAAAGAVNSSVLAGAFAGGHTLPSLIPPSRTLTGIAQSAAPQQQHAPQPAVAVSVANAAALQAQQQQQIQPPPAPARPQSNSSPHTSASAAASGSTPLSFVQDLSVRGLEAVKGQLTDLLLRRNLEEQRVHASKKAETSESLLAQERDAREASTREVLQLKLLLAEAEEARAAAVQQQRAAAARAAKEASAAAELRVALECSQARLAAKDEELGEARLLQESLVKELGVLASRYSKLTMDGSHDGGIIAGMHAHVSGSTMRSTSSAAHILLGSSRSPHSELLAAAGSSAAAGLERSPRHPAGGGGLGGQRASHDDDDDDGSGGGGVHMSVPLERCAGGGVSSSSQVPLEALAAPLSAHGAPMQRAGGAGAGTTANSCQQLLSLLSNSELQRATLLEDMQVLKAKLEDLRQQNALMYTEVQQMHAGREALESLSFEDMEELEGKLEGSLKALREALVLRRVYEAQRRQSSEQNQCALCMEAPRGVVFSCGHQTCEPCSIKLVACPFCRTAISAKIRLYDA